jgi:hypothetical protein
MRASPLYRSVNTRTHGVKHGLGDDFRHERHTKAFKSSDAGQSSMHSRHRHGRDYTPLFRFLLAHVGSRWDEVYSEARSRLDSGEPIFWLVARSESDRKALVRVGESSYYSGMFVDENGVLSLVDPDLKPRDMKPSCTCCTHTLNGIRFGTLE